MLAAQILHSSAKVSTFCSSMMFHPQYLQQSCNISKQAHLLCRDYS